MTISITDTIMPTQYSTMDHRSIILAGCFSIQHMMAQMLKFNLTLRGARTASRNEKLSVWIEAGAKLMTYDHLSDSQLDRAINKYRTLCPLNMA